MTALYKITTDMHQVELMKDDLILSYLRFTEKEGCPDNIELINSFDQSLTDTLEGLNGEIEIKLLDIAALIKNYEAEEEQMEIYIEKMRDRRAALTGFINRIKFYLKKTMIKHDFKKINGIEFDVSIRKSTYVDVHDPELLNERYIKTKITKDVNKVLIKEDIKAGKFVGEGAALETNENLVIR